MVISDEIYIDCPRCHQSFLVSFISKRSAIILEQDECPKCEYDWSDYAISQIQEQLEESPCYDEEYEVEREKEYKTQVLSLFSEYLECE